MIHETIARTALKALRLDVDFLFVEAVERGVVFLLGVQGSPTPCSEQPGSQREGPEPRRIAITNVRAIVGRDGTFLHQSVKHVHSPSRDLPSRCRVLSPSMERASGSNPSRNVLPGLPAPRY